MRDLRIALRTLTHRPGLALTVIVTLSLGIAATSAVFSVVDAVLLRPLPFRAPGELIHVSERGEDGRSMNFSWPDYLDFRLARGLAGTTLYKTNSMVLGASDRPRQIAIAQVTEDFFSVLGVTPTPGRGLSSADEGAGAVLSHRLWRDAFGADPDLVGHTVLLDTRSYTVVGIAPPGFDLPRDVDAWLVLRPPTDAPRTGHSMGRVIGRLAPGMTIAQASAELNGIARTIQEHHHPSIALAGADVEPLEEEIVAKVRPALQLLLGAVSLVLLIACVNVANLLLASGAVRRHEFALRTALGASRGHLVRQLLIESLLLAGTAGAIGVLFAALGTELLVSLGARELPRIAGVTFSGNVLALALAVTLATGLAFGLLPALHGSRVDLNEDLKSGGHLAPDRRMARTRQILVAAEVALALMLLVGATLLLGSFWRVTRVATGYRAEQLLTARISLPGVRYGNRDAVRRFAEELLPRLQAIPGLTIAAVADTPPLADDYNQMGMVLEGEPPRSDLPRDQLTAVTSRYFETLGIQLLAGRPFTAGDGQDAPPVAIVDRLVAKRIGGDPVGRRIRIGPAGEPWRTVIGVVAEVKRAARELPAEPQVYVPYAQRAAWDFSILLRSGLPVGQLASAAEAAVRAVDPGQPIYAVRTMEQLLGESVAHRRFTMQLVLLFGAAALGLAGLGIYGVVAHAAATRSREMAIRLALGACGRKVIRAVVGQGLRPVIAGVAAGTAGAIATSRAIAGLLYGTVPVEPVLYGGAMAFLFTVAVLAAWLPARRVARIDPMSVMRSE